jgi:hypothetical protein
LSSFILFQKIFEKINKESGLKQQLIPYFISSHPRVYRDRHGRVGCCDQAFGGSKLEQIQDFTPSPMTVATEIYYTGYHPYTLEKVYTARTKEQKLAQRQFFFWYDKGYRPQIIKELKRLKREDLLKRLY